MFKNLLILIFSTITFVCSSQRNVVLIIADDLGTDYFGFYADYKDTVDVPNIRKLLQRGVKFNQATANPVCSATRSTILTGRYSFRTGVGGIVGGAGGSNPLDTAEVTIPKLLKKNNSNIRCANIGKWHLQQPAPVWNLLNPLRMGYDHFEGCFIGQLTNFTNWTKHTNGVQSICTNYATSENVNNAITWLKNQNSKPFFLWLAFNAPHAPYHLPPLNLHSYKTLSGTQQDINQNPKKYFKAALQAMDTEIGRFMDSLKTLNQLDSTDFIFIGDNGNTTQTAQITNINRSKGTVYEYGVHVPMIISGPSVVNQNRSTDALVNVADIFATVLELNGVNNWQSQIPVIKPVDSKSLLPILKNENIKIRNWSFCENFKLMPDSTDGKAIRNEKYKLIRFDNQIQEFYNLSLDNEEAINLLKTNLTTEDITNYQYLCNEMSNLVGKGDLCIKTVNNNDLSSETFDISPNPFQDYIHIFPKNNSDVLILTNVLGKIIYSGNDIENQNFSTLEEGIYFIRNKNNIWQSKKLIKIK